MMFYPEMGEVAQPRLFATRHVYNGTYSARWAEVDDAKAKEHFRKLRIRPSAIRDEEGKFPSDLEQRGKIKNALLTSSAHRKLMDLDLCAHEVLLD